MKMIAAYLSLAWWLLPPAILLWWARRWLLTPWARYVSHTTEPGQEAKVVNYVMREATRTNWFLTVRHVHWWPPFSDYDVTYRSFISSDLYTTRYWWASENTGETVSEQRDNMLTSMAKIADYRARETEEMLKGVK